ncbi:MAG: hypothetical protein DI537_48965 [Stutzerimonas stutzeri]|nr:MAG: hypothetical protein DI537_48965 [Stutzerimonas stutzeri]
MSLLLTRLLFTAMLAPHESGVVHVDTASERLDKLRAEALARLRAYSDHPPMDLIPRYLLKFGPESGGRTLLKNASLILERFPVPNIESLECY